MSDKEYLKMPLGEKLFLWGMFIIAIVLLTISEVP